MTHNRTYQNALDGSYALRIIRTMAGRKFDVRAVEAFCRAYAAGRVVLPKRDESVEEDRFQENVSPIESLHRPLDVLASDDAVRSSLIGVSSN
jgi:hypothetical protein